jgi:hypothetical protein
MQATKIIRELRKIDIHNFLVPPAINNLESYYPDEKVLLLKMVLVREISTVHHVFYGLII